MVKLIRRWLLRWALRKTNLNEFYGALPTATGPNYTAMDRFRDFHLVFYSTDAGMRVYQQIIAMCEGEVLTQREMESHTALVRRAARREIGLEIAQAANIQPIFEQQEKALTDG